MTDSPVYTHALHILCVLIDLLHGLSEFVRSALLNHFSCNYPFKCLYRNSDSFQSASFLMYADKYVDKQLTCKYSGTLKSFHVHAHIFIRVRCNDFVSCLSYAVHESIYMILIFISPNHSSHFNMKFHSRRRSFLLGILQVYLPVAR